MLHFQLNLQLDSVSSFSVLWRSSMSTELDHSLRQIRGASPNEPHPLTHKMASKAVQYGGHDYSFVSEVPDRFICQICTKVLCDPHLAVCCGQHFCESCLNQWFTRQGKESCPHCRAEGEAFNHVIHKGLRSEVNQLKIRCSNYGEGCQWTGELGTLKKHLESDIGCGYVLVKCPNQCNSWVTKRT